MPCPVGPHGVLAPFGHDGGRQGAASLGAKKQNTAAATKISSTRRRLANKDCQRGRSAAWVRAGEGDAGSNPDAAKIGGKRGDPVARGGARSLGATTGAAAGRVVREGVSGELAVGRQLLGEQQQLSKRVAIRVEGGGSGGGGEARGRGGEVDAFDTLQQLGYIQQPVNDNVPPPPPNNTSSSPRRRLFLAAIGGAVLAETAGWGCRTS
jgi:hypothetical protein